MKFRQTRLLITVAALAALSACKTTDPLTPGRDHFARETVTTPAGEAQCDDDDDGVFEPCLSEAQADNLFNDVVDALCRANDKLAWLDEYFHDVELMPSCGTKPED